MTRKAAIASTGAGISLIAAAVVLVIAVSGFVAFRGFDRVSAAPEVRQDARLAPVESAATPHPQRVVVGARSAAPRRTRPAAARQPARRRRSAARPVAAPEASEPAPSPPVREPAPEPAPSRPDPVSPPPVAQAPDRPVPDLVDEVTRPAETLTEKVGDALLDVRDVLP